MYKVIYPKISEKFILKLDLKDQKQILNKIERIRINPKKYLIKLINSNSYKLRVGDFRLFIDLYKEELIILVVKLGRRKNVYKK